MTHNILFGFIECDIKVPERWEGSFKPDMSPSDYFSEMCPPFDNTEIPFESIGDHMQNFLKEAQMNNHLAKGKSRDMYNFKIPKHNKLLSGAMKAEKIILSSPLLKWYLEHGLVVTRIYQVIEFQRDAYFK